MISYTIIMSEMISQWWRFYVQKYSRMAAETDSHLLNNCEKDSSSDEHPLKI